MWQFWALLTALFILVSVLREWTIILFLVLVLLLIIYGIIRLIVWFFYWGEDNDKW
jgi:uncharacterized membrane protein HdeD (DUF308 family)